MEAITKYENGERKPPPEFIYVVSLALGLSDPERDALVEAAVADINNLFFLEYSQAVSKWFSRVKQSAKD